MQTQVVTILGIEQKHGTGKTGKPYMIFKVKASDGNEYSTFDAPIAQQAAAAGGAPVVLEYEARQNGEYTNYDLKVVSLAQQAVAAPVAAPAVASAVATPVSGSVPPGVEPSTFQQEKDARITRLSAASTAFQYAAAASWNENEALLLAEKIEKFANEGAGPQPQTFEPVPPAPGELPWS